jgi:hypothetical protein
LCDLSVREIVGRVGGEGVIVAIETLTRILPSLPLVVKGTILGVSVGAVAVVVLTIEVVSSRVSSVGLAASGATIWVDVTVGRGAMVLPEGSTVRTVVLLTVSCGGVTVTTFVLGVWVLDSLVVVVDEPMLFMISASLETPASMDWLLELLEDEDEDEEEVEVEDEVELEVEVLLVDVLRVVVSTTGPWEACGM